MTGINPFLKEMACIKTAREMGWDLVIDPVRGGVVWVKDDTEGETRCYRTAAELVKKETN